MQSFCVPTSKIIGGHHPLGANSLHKALNDSLTAYALFGNKMGKLAPPLHAVRRELNWFARPTTLEES